MHKELQLIKEFLDEKVLIYNNKNFIQNDPISIPHRFTKKEDIEISAFLVATISWGNRLSIISNGKKLMERMDNSPHDFILHHTKKDYMHFSTFVHRTFNGDDCTFFLKSLKNIYTCHGGLETVFTVNNYERQDLKSNIMSFRKIFLQPIHENRVEKHVSNPDKKSSAKRLCMFLRWMVRSDRKGVDFGIWKNISASNLCLPLDVHTGNISRKLGLLNRTQNDWQAVQEITSVLKTLDENDPIKYDFALFGLGVDKSFKNL